MAKELWKELVESFKSDEQDIPDFIQEKIVELGDESKSLDEIKELVIEIISRINKGR